MRRSFFALALVAAVSACVGPPPPPPPQPRPRLAPPPPPPQVTAPAKVLGEDWRDWPYTPGDWVYRQDARGSIALYGQAGADAELTLRCDRAAHMMYLSRKGVAAASATIRTSTMVRSVQMVLTGGAPSYVAVALSPRDPLLDAMGFSRGRFVIEQPGQLPLVVPAWAEVERVTEDCRG